MTTRGDRDRLDPTQVRKAALTCYFVVKLVSLEGAPGRHQIARTELWIRALEGSNPSERAMLELQFWSAVP